MCSLEFRHRWDLPQKKLVDTGTSQSSCSSRLTVLRISSIQGIQEAPLVGGPRPRDSVPVLHSILKILGAGASAAGHILSVEQHISISTIRTLAQTEEGGWV